MWLESDAIVGSQSSPPQYPSRRTLTAAWLTAGAAMAQAVATAAMIVTSLRDAFRKAHDFRDVLAITVIPLSSHRNDNCGERSAKYQRGQPFPLARRPRGSEGDASIDIGRMAVKNPPGLHGLWCPNPSYVG